jgi:DNA processing protein
LLDIKKILIDDPKYPELLRNIYDPPKELFIRGNIDLLNTKCLAIVGTRKATLYGKQIARKLSRQLAEVGITVVSGLAEGIDTEAHLGALDAGGNTIAVFGSGIDVIFPAQNIGLAKKIEISGSLISEYPEGFSTAKWTFPRRNRIISGLSLGVIMIEGGYESGAMITAKHALDEGREVFALPGNVDLEQSKGPHWLIKQGAKLIENVDDILEELNMKRVDTGDKKEMDVSQLSIDEVPIIKTLNKEPKHIDELSAAIKIDTSVLLGTLLNLEMKGYVKKLPGMYFIISC